MEVYFTPEPEPQPAYIAAKAGADPERLVKDATDHPQTVVIVERLIPDNMS
jgi:hypothetical protein